MLAAQSKGQDRLRQKSCRGSGGRAGLPSLDNGSRRLTGRYHLASVRARKRDGHGKNNIIIAMSNTLLAMVLCREAHSRAVVPCPLRSRDPQDFFSPAILVFCRTNLAESATAMLVVR